MLPPPLQISISAVTTHPSFASDPVVFPFLHDIALVRLARPATLNENVQLVCLPVDERVCRLFFFLFTIFFA